MKTFLTFSMIFLFLLTAKFSSSQEQKNTGSTVTDPNTKSQDHNSSRSNKSSSSIAPNSGQPTVDQSKNDANLKKGYDYYKAKSDLNSAGAKVQEPNSSGGNKPSQGSPKEDSEAAKKAFNQNSSRSNNPQPKK